MSGGYKIADYTDNKFVAGKFVDADGVSVVTTPSAETRIKDSVTDDFNTGCWIYVPRTCKTGPPRVVGNPGANNKAGWNFGTKGCTSSTDQVEFEDCSIINPRGGTNGVWFKDTFRDKDSNGNSTGYGSSSSAAACKARSQAWIPNGYAYPVNEDSTSNNIGPDRPHKWCNSSTTENAPSSNGMDYPIYHFTAETSTTESFEDNSNYNDTTQQEPFEDNSGNYSFI